MHAAGCLFMLHLSALSNWKEIFSLTGLCGTLDGNKNNDLLQKDGTLSTETGKHPNVFSKTWR